MARVQPPAPSPAPTPPIQRGDRATFSNRVDAAITYLTNAPAEIGNIAQITYGNAVDSFNSATASAASASEALDYRGTALTYRNEAQQARTDAQTYAQNASTSATNAATSATAAANSALGLIANSTSSNTLATGTKTFTVEAGKQIGANQPMIAVSKSDPTKYLYGQVTYSGTTLTMTATEKGGTGSASDWTIAPSGVRGPQGVAGTGGYTNIAILTTTQSFTIPATAFEVELAGPAGGAQVGSPGNGGIPGAQGGPSGGYVRKLFTGATVGASAMFVAGTVGIKGNGSTQNATSGTDSSFSVPGFTPLVAGGGKIILLAQPSIRVGEGGSASGGDINIPGQRGGAATISSQDLDYLGGDGGSHPLGSAGVGFPSVLPASPATGWGAGGAGGVNTTTGAGNGAPAVAIIRW